MQELFVLFIELLNCGVNAEFLFFLVTNWPFIRLIGWWWSTIILIVDFEEVNS